MKTTGIFRRIDELGRIVIPKEIRKNLHINEGDNLEIFIESNEIILKKFSIMKNINDLAQKLCDIATLYIKDSILICDNSTVIAASGPLKTDYLNCTISRQLEKSIKNVEKNIVNDNSEIEIIEQRKIKSNYIINTIVSNGEPIGLVIILALDINDFDYKISCIISDFIGKYLEI